MEVGFLRGLSLWKTISGGELEPFSKRLVDARWCSRVGGEWAGDLDVGVEPLVPDKHVETFDLFYQHDDRPSCGCDFCTCVALKSGAPRAQDVELVGVQPLIVHGATLSPQSAAVCMSLRFPARISFTLQEAPRE